VDEYSLADLVEITGAKRRSLQIWADRGVIQPIKSTINAGTGVHRLFSRTEAIIACIIHPFALRQIAVGELHQIAAIVRSALVHRDAEWDRKSLAEVLEEMIAGDLKGDLMLVVYSRHNERGGPPSHFLRIGGDEEFDLNRMSKPGALCMAIQLRNYLAKLK
jgi:hypothetical protein